jgi:penicillin-binding protein 1A
MPDYSDEELQRYFTDRAARRSARNKDDEPLNPQTVGWRIVGTMSVTIIAGLLVMVGYMWTLTDDMPSLKQLENPNLELATVVYSSDGVEMARFRHKNRTWVAYEQISPHAIEALVATEDHRFYEHWGVDLFRTLSIPYHLLRLDPQGASTITQQLARNLYQQQIGYEVSVARKIKEIMTAVQIERRYTKQEILEMYLNTVAFGHNSFGIESAAQTYFSTEAASLDRLQSATLIGILKGTSYYDPRSHPERARNRRNTVLTRMYTTGYLSPDRFRELVKQPPVELEYHSPAENARFASYFAERIRLRLNEWMEENDHNVYTDGLVVHTTLDSKMQKAAEAVVEDKMNKLQAVVDVNWGRRWPLPVGPYGNEWAPHVEFLKENPDFEPFSYYWETHGDALDRFIRSTPRYAALIRGDLDRRAALEQLKNNESFLDSLKTSVTRLESGFVALDPTSGDVRAWVGGRNFSTDKYDHVSIARRQPGSTFKPFVYTAAIDNGYSPEYSLRDDTVQIRDPYTGDVWQPRNFGGTVTGEMKPIREGLQQSLNTITARLVREIGPQRVVSYAHRMGIDTPLDAVPSIALGTSEVTLLEMASAYTTLANQGLHAEPRLISRIEDRHGNVLAQFPPSRNVALSEQTAYTMIDLMRGVIDEGTGIRIRSQYNIAYDVAGKTGTTQNGADGWFMLLHPRLVTGAWVGFNSRQISFRTNTWGQGAHNALHLAGDFFQRAITDPEIGLPNEAFVPPPNYREPTPDSLEMPFAPFRPVSTDNPDSGDW